MLWSRPMSQSSLPPSSTSYEKLSLSVPTDLFQQLDRLAQAADESRSQTFVRFLRQGLDASEATAKLQAEITVLNNRTAELHARLAEAEARPRPPVPDFQDFLTGSPKGMSKLKRGLDLAERRLLEEAGKTADAKRAEAHWHARARALWATLKQTRDAAEAARSEGADAMAAALAEQRESETAAEAEIARLRQEILNQFARADRANSERANERARKVPWHWTLPLPVPRFFVVDVPYRTPHRPSWLRGLASGLAAMAVAMVVIPYDTSSMRRVATLAMGTSGDVPRAAARLHGGPIMGGDSLLQAYALLRAGDNPRRLDSCFERARVAARKVAAKSTGKGGREDPLIDCTIRVPGEFALYFDLVTSGPHADTSSVVQTERRYALRRQESLARLDRKDQGKGGNRSSRDTG